MKHIKLLLALLFIPCIFLTGCVSAGIYAVQKTVDTVDGSKLNMIMVVPKRHNITSINRLEIDIQYLKLKSKEIQKKDAVSSLQNLIIKALKGKGLYHPNDNKGYKLKVTISNITDSYSDKSVQSFVEVFNSKGFVQMSAVYIMNGEGLRQLSYVKERFAESLARTLNDPIKK